MPAPYPRVPYGETNFKTIRLERALWVDKTRFLHRLEAERYVVLIRPRRFGKTSWVSVLDHYYDRAKAASFDAVFAGTDIGRCPTADHSRYVVLRLNFSAFKNALATLEEYFEEYCQLQLRAALERNPDLFPEAALRRIRAPKSINGQLNELFIHAADHDVPLYVLVDEYDNFANTVLAHHGEAAYQSLTHGGGFYRSFFATLKAGTEGNGGIERLFLTGVSPVTLDDVTSGFNIGSNLSLEPEFNEMVGFTEDEVRGLLETCREHGVFDQDVDAALGVMGEWYNGYRFAREATGDLYNTDMVLYYIKKSISLGHMPDQLIDHNVRIDYGKLRHLLVAGQETAARERAASAALPSSQRAAPQAVRPNGNFDLLRDVIGEGQALAMIEPSFPLERLTVRDNFLSLLYYFGLLSIRGVSEGLPRLGVPNQTVWRLMYGYLNDAYRDLGVFSVGKYEFSRLAHEMAYRGAWRPAFEFLRDALVEQTGIRDYIDGEKVVQTFLATYFGLPDYFQPRSEPELNLGYADLYLAPNLAQHPGMAYAYVIELKYIKRSESLSESLMADTTRAAQEQLRHYLADQALRRRHPSVQHVGVAVVFHGWEMVACEAAEGDLGNSRDNPLPLAASNSAAIR